jgi:hypothetical protein
MGIWESLGELRREVRERRPGFYASRVSAAGDALRRVQLVPEWLQDGALDRALAILPPLLDVVPPVGARLATMGRDGLPGRPAWFGVLWDSAPTMTAWLRADLARHAGHVELGANSSVRIRVGADLVTIQPQADGTLLIEASGRVIVSAPDVRLGSDAATKKVALAEDVEARFEALEGAFLSHVHASAAPAAPTTTPVIMPDPPAPPGSATPIDLSPSSVGAAKVRAE